MLILSSLTQKVTIELASPGLIKKTNKKKSKKKKPPPKTPHAPSTLLSAPASDSNTNPVPDELFCLLVLMGSVPRPCVFCLVGFFCLFGWEVV